MSAYRASLLRFDAAGSAVLDTDGLLVVDAAGKVAAAGDFAQLKSQFVHVPTQHLPGRIIAPGFVDLHVHYPQIDVIGSPADGLLPWLENYTFPEEKRFVAQEYSAQTATFFIAELMRNGVTTALTFATSHVASVNAMFKAADVAGLRIITGKCLQDRNCPDGVRDETEQSLIDTESLIQQWHGKGTRGQLGYAITPRFAPTCSDAQMRGMGELAAKYPDVWIQSHVSENVDEIAWVKELYPQDASYLAVYDRFGLLRHKSIYAHSIHFDDADRALMKARSAAAAVCPTSNLFLGSGNFDFADAANQNMLHGLASDVGGGTSFSPFKNMLAAYYVSRSSSRTSGLAKQAMTLSPEQLWWLHSAGAARALGLEGVVGNLQIGCDADFVILNPQATPLLARRTGRAENLAELLFALIVLGDDRVIEQTHLATS
ncbi:guanine deaminase [Variovorax sp. PCZ-1]|uniref:guanine deaminase n=1 Tax=Variovorax sp. PCZ-1 TaxID=2835533 RepID=UPI001BCB843E|nr:guanine deaminase [Variovorax sp. PCZ-1]